jgi:hypothetical protein
MAKNTGRGSRVEANSSTSGQFVEAKKRGGAFKGAHDTRPWDQRHPSLATLVVAVAVVAVFVIVLALANAIPAVLR